MLQQELQSGDVQERDCGFCRGGRLLTALRTLEVNVTGVERGGLLEGNVAAEILGPV